MTKLVFNYSNIKNTCIPNIEAVTYQLSKAINIMEGLNIPKMFDKVEKIGNIKQNIKNRKADIEKVEDWIVKSNAVYEKTSIDCCNAIKMIADISITRRG